MAATTTPPNIEPGLAAPVRRRIAVAYSGGRDSSALLHATARMAADLNAAMGVPGQGAETALIEVVGLHVHHGLSAQADDWLAHAQRQCRQWADEGLPVSLAWRHLRLEPSAGQSVEALARQARYLALTSMAQAAGCEAVLLAHHQRDQAETFLLQALRSAGPAGLASMPARADRGGVRWLRPWLSYPREAVEAYVASHGLACVEDDSNLDQRFARNRLRWAVWPALTQAFDGAEARLAQAAAHQADLQCCLDEWLDSRLDTVTRVHEGQQVLDVAAWLGCSPAAQRQLLRAWFDRTSGAPLPMRGVKRLQDDLVRMSAGAGLTSAARWPWPCADEMAFAGGPWQGCARPAPRELVLYRGLLSVRQLQVALQDVSAAGQSIGILTLGLHELPDGLGVLQIVAVEQGGVALSALARARLLARSGGEQFQLAPNRPARSLKKQFQLRAVPSWARQGPLLYVGDRLVFVPGLGIDARAWAGEGEPQVGLSWQPTQIGDKDRPSNIPGAKSGAGG